jgi:1-aminocyclopropane-1-carboxylate deaminase/D-cysteine desulfhydrase-like pyridoxal-dependent ACC family enzyme
MFGTSRKKLEKQQYEADMQQLKAQQEMEIRMLQRQAQLQAATIATNTIGTASDYRGQYSIPQDNTSTILRNVQASVRGLHDEVNRLKGFYEWMIHAYPETIAQYKALMDLQRASNNNEVGEARVERASY